MRMLTKYVGTIGLLIAATTLAACSSDSTDPYDDGNGNQTVFGGTIDGSAWAALTPLASRSGTSIVTVSVFGFDAQNREITITITGATGSGSYAIGNTGPAAVTLSIGAQAWAGHLAGASGSVTLSSLSSTSMTGTFNVTLAPLAGGATGTRVLIGAFTAYFGQT